MNSVMPFNNVVFYKKYIKDPERILEILKKSEYLTENSGLFTPWSDWQGNWYGKAMNTKLPPNIHRYLSGEEDMQGAVNEDQEYLFTEIYSAYWNIIKDYASKCKDIGPWPYFMKTWDLSNWNHWTPSNLNILKYTEERDTSHDHDPKEGYYNLAMNYHTDINENNFDSRGAKQIITLTFYLNDNFEGGELSFYDGTDNKVYYYKPAPGDVTVFPSFPPYYHAVQPFKGKARYLIRTFFLYNHAGTEEWLKNEKDYGEAIWQEMENKRLEKSYYGRDHLLNVVLPGDIGDGTNSKRVFVDNPIIID